MSGAISGVVWCMVWLLSQCVVIESFLRPVVFHYHSYHSQRSLVILLQIVLSPCRFQTFSRDCSMFSLRTIKKISLGELIYYRFDHFYVIVYILFRVFMLCLESILVYLQVQVRSGTLWTLWSLNGAKPVAEQMKKRQSLYPKEVSVDTHPWCRSTPDARSFADQYQDLSPEVYIFTRMPLTSFYLEYVCCAIVYTKTQTETQNRFLA